MRDEILIITNSEDATANLVIRHLRAMDQRFYRLDTDLIPSQSTLAMRLTGTTCCIRLSAGSMSQQLDCVKSVWHRRPTIPRALPSIKEEYSDFIEAEWRACLWSLYTTLPAFWVNPPLVGHRLLEHNKLFQLKAAVQVGLMAPITLITNDASELVNFCESCDGVVAVKTISGHFFKKSDGSEAFGIYTNPVSAEFIRAHIEDIRCAPVMAQEYVPKKFELRVTIVGEKIFACAIYSQDSERTKHDWRRYDFERVKHESHQLPSEIEGKLLRLMKIWGLRFGAIDMVLTPDDHYVFLEINPNGQWGWIEQLTGMPISQAIAELLANPSKRET